MIDITKMLINLSYSMQPIQSLLSGMGYFSGLIFIVSGLIKLKKVGESRGAGQKEGAFSAIAFIVGGSLLIYLPSSVSVLSNTFFGASNVLSYSSDIAEDPVYHAMMVIIQTAGLIWFVRGTVLIINASKPGEQNGPKGFTFLIAGILAINIYSSIEAFNYALNYLFSMIANLKAK
jgi:hypothetical protein